MQYRATLLCLFLLMSATSSSAQEPSGRVDLDVASAAPGLFVTQVPFVGSDGECPDDRGTLRISGALRLIRTSSPTDPRLSWNWRATFHAIDDQTWQYRIATTNCRMDIAVRQQVLHDGSWTSLFIPSEEHPSAGLKRIRELLDQIGKSTPDRKELTLAEQESVDRFRAATTAIHTAGSLRMSVGISSLSFGFVDHPQTCFEAVGDYQIGATGIVFSFPTDLPGDLNRFVIERTDLDANHGRLLFMRGVCRIELTVGQSVLRDGQWVALPLAPSPSPKG
jgi:hypothetical protein